MANGAITSAVIGALGSLFNKPTASPYETALAGLTNLQAGSYRQYMPQLLQLLYGQLKGKTSPDLQAQETSALANANNDFSRLLAQAGQAYAGRGLARSNVASGGYHQLADRTARGMATIRMNRLGAEEARVQQALRALLAAVSGQGNSAMDEYGTLAQMDNQRRTRYHDRLFTSLEALAQQLFRNQAA